MIKNFEVKYLLPFRKNSSAKEDKLTGYFLHSQTVIAHTEQEVWNLVNVNTNGVIPVDIKEIAAPIFKRKPSRVYRQEFLKAIESNIKAGISPQQALLTVIDSEVSDIKHHFTQAISIIGSGGSFVDAVNSIEFYDSATISIIEAGEKTGKLPDALSAAIEQYDSSGNTLKLMVLPLGYIFSEIIAQFSFTIGNLAAIPMFKQQAQESISEQNKATIQVVLEQYDWLSSINNYLILFTILFGLFFIMVFTGYFSPFKKHKIWADSVINYIPFLNKMLIHSQMAASAKVLSNLLTGGVIIQKALPMIIKSTDGEVKEYYEKSFDSMETGKTITDSLGNHEFLLPVERMRLKSFSNSKQLADIYKNVIHQQRSELAQKNAKKFTKLVFIFGGVYILVGLGVSIYIGVLSMKTML